MAGQGAGSGVDSARAWAIAVAGLLVNATCWGTIFSFGAFLDSMKDEFGTGLGATALIFGLPSFVAFGLGIVAGPVADQHGPRRIVLAGAVLIGAGLFATSRAPNFGVALVAYGLGVGLGVACYLVPLTACVGGWFVRHRAIALGLTSSGIGIGTLFLVPVAQWMIEDLGWRTAYAVLAVVCAASLVVAAAVSARPPHAVPAGRPSLRRLREAAARGPFLQLYLGGLLFSAALYVPFVFLVRYATDHDASDRSAALLLSVLGASNVASRLATTALAGRVGAVRMFLACFGVLPVGFALWLAAGSSYAALAAFAVLLGISHGGYVALGPEVTAQLFGVANLGTVLGALWTAPGLGGLVSPVLAGVLIESMGYGPTIVVALAAALLALVAQRPLWALARPPAVTSAAATSATGAPAATAAPAPTAPPRP